MFFMKGLFKKIWHDPVWSGVISGVLVAFLGVLFSLVKSLVSENVNMWEGLKIVFGFKVSIWLVLIVFWIILIVFRVVEKRRRNAKAAPNCPFVKGFVTGNYQGHIWVWNWKWYGDQKIYYVDDLSIKCPKCKDGLLTIDGSGLNYWCGKCGISIPYDCFNVDFDAVKNQILNDARKKYPESQSFVGEINTGWVRQ